MEKTFSIPCPDHIKSYVEKAFFDGMTAPYKITERSLLGKMIMACLLDKRKSDVMDIEVEFADNESKSTLDIELSDTLAKRSPNLIKLSRINFFLEKLFYHSLYEFCTGQRLASQSRYAACNAFYSIYCIENKSLINRGHEYLKERDSSPYKKHKLKLNKNGNTSSATTQTG